jgi:hypothetical protein
MCGQARTYSLTLALLQVLRIRSPLVEIYIKCSFTLLIGFGTFLLKFLLTSIDIGGAIEFKVRRGQSQRGPTPFVWAGCCEGPRLRQSPGLH